MLLNFNKLLMFELKHRLPPLRNNSDVEIKRLNLGNFEKRGDNKSVFVTHAFYIN
jgi:hypothetical protein